jgi:peptide/nickel transport system substrate-binding protein
MRSARAFVAICLAAVALASCHARTNAAGDSSTLRVAVRKDPISLNPLLLEGIGAYTFGELMYSYLTTYDASGRITGDLASGVPSIANHGISPDGLRVTFHLRHDARWQDGTPVTSRDVAFSFHAVMNPDNNVPERYGYDVIRAITTPDLYTVVIKLARPFSPILSLFFGGDSNYTILPAHLLASLPNLNAAPYNSNPVGSGPYKLQQWDRGDRLVLDANPTYFHGKPGIERIVLPFIPDDGTTIEQLQTGELDAGFFVDTSRVEQLRAIPNHRLVITPVPYFYAMGFNLHDPALADRTVREALSQAIDAKSLVRKITHGVDDPNHPLRGLFTWAYDPQISGVPYNLAAARAELTAAGWLPGSDGIREKDGKRLTLQLAIPVGSDVTTSLATAIAAAEHDAGVSVSLRQYDRNQFLAEDGPLLKGRYQLSVYDYQSNYDPDASWLLACDQQAPHGFNMTYYCNPTVDALLHKAASLYDRASRTASYRTVQQIIQHDLPYDFLTQTSEVDVIPNNLEGYVPPLLSPFNFVADWRWKATSAR